MAPVIRREAFTRFILTLSDQQLVTGLAILIAALNNRCETSRYEFDIAVSLAWFSTITPLATMDALHEYFCEHPEVRNWRLVGIGVVMLLLLVCLLFQNTSSDMPPTTPVQCVIDDISINIDWDFSNYIIVVVIVLSAFFNRLVNLLEPQDRSLNGYLWLFRESVRLKFRKSDWSRKEFNRVFDQRFKDLVTRRKASSATATAGSYWPRFSYLMAEYETSYLSQIPSLWFGLSYGLTQVIIARWDSQAVPDDQANIMGFGQIVPLVLLVLPMFSASEVYYGKITILYTPY
jgi:hypothetical protein